MQITSLSVFLLIFFICVNKLKTSDMLECSRGMYSVQYVVLLTNAHQCSDCPEQSCVFSFFCIVTAQSKCTSMYSTNLSEARVSSAAYADAVPFSSSQTSTLPSVHFPFFIIKYVLICWSNIFCCIYNAWDGSLFIFATFDLKWGKPLMIITNNDIFTAWDIV